MSEVDEVQEFENLCKKLELILREEVEYDVAIKYIKKIEKIKYSVIAEGDLSYEDGICHLNDILDELEVINETTQTN